VALTNPPFGTKNNAGVDLMFVQAGLAAAQVVYSMHKTSTRRFVQKRCGQLNADAEVVARLRYDLPRTYKFHR
jgi:putative methylase